MPVIRGLDQLIADLDRRQRPDARSRNRVISKYATVQDTVTLSTDAITTTVQNSTNAFLWASSTAYSSTTADLYWDLGTWM